MRCSKCGYISFDYLSECKKCNTGLEAVRDAMGFLPIKPGLPFALGVLFDPSADTQPKAETPLPDFSDSSLPEIEFGDDFELDSDLETPPPGSASSRTADLSASGADSSRDDSDELMLDLEDVDLDHLLKEEEPVKGIDLIQDEEPVKDLDFDVEFALENDFAPRSESASLEMPEKREAKDVLVLETEAEEEIEISDDDLVLDIRPENEPSFELELETALAPASDGVEHKAAPKGMGESEDNLVIELSDADLENLLVDLEESSGKKD